jgi:hypothetical protein
MLLKYVKKDMSQSKNYEAGIHTSKKNISKYISTDTHSYAQAQNTYKVFEGRRREQETQ